MTPATSPPICNGWREAVDDDDGYDELVLWFEHDLFDQLNLIQLLTHLGGRPRSKPVTLICIDRYPGHPNFKGLGELAPRDLAALFETTAAGRRRRRSRWPRGRGRRIDRPIRARSRRC